MTLSLPQVRGNPGNEFDRFVQEHQGELLDGLSIQTVQVNIGLRCNLACGHCHVESSPARQEAMTWETMGQVLDGAHAAGAKTLDITGGAPEMHPHFRQFVTAAVEQGLSVIVRTNLTILLEDGYRDLPTFFCVHGVHLIASLPCYLERNVDRQRGSGTYRESIDALRMLNAIGYGIDARLPLDLVYNPLGAALPPPQQKLEDDYRRELRQQLGIWFTRLIAITNVPIGRFLHDLARQGKDREYQQLLQRTFNPATLSGLMCRHQLHVGWDGSLFDCDFNFALNLAVNLPACGHIRDFDPGRYLRRSIATGNHCFGCTAGSGSSCGGALV